MKYYEVWVGSQRYHGDKPLTYSSELDYKVGTVVIVNLQNKKTLGIISSEVPRPTFNTQPILKQAIPKALPKTSLELFEWLKSYYPGPTGLIAQLFMPNGLLQDAKKEVPIETSNKKTSAPLPRLGKDQERALKIITGSKSKSFLLHGDTGTGKTRVYIELAKQQIKNGKSVIVLTPEIGLTPQLVKMFEESFAGQIITTHSDLTPSQRRDTWLKVLGADQPLVIIGPRSSLFSPVGNLGLVVVDEAHDGAYKQEQAPHYQATRVAARLAQLHNAPLVLGTATPLVTDFYTFNSKGLPIIRMRKPAVKTAIQTKISAHIIELRDKTQFSKSAWISNRLLRELQINIENGEQALLFLNRRGTARIVLCQDCGWQLLCPRCDLPLTYHGDTHNARCHTCGYKTNVPPECPVCASTQIIFKSIGTKLIAEEVGRLLPGANIRRFDSDNTKAERLEQHYKSVRAGEVDILVGTQLLSKGLDLPKLSLVGVIVADTGLYIPDYTAEEKTYQMISQVIGRVGRGHRDGRAIIQTYHPDSPAITAALQKDYERFYEKQISERGTFVFPPFCYLLKLVVARSTRDSAEKACLKLAVDLQDGHFPISVIGPTPAFHEKQQGKYHWQLVIKAKQRSVLINIIKTLPSGWNYDIDPTNLL
jgi:primosomal protein N' (replication factor Y)